MADNVDYIDDYYSGALSADDLRLFDQRVIDDPVFAGDLAFYMSSVSVIKEQVNEDRKQRFRELYEQNKNNARIKPVRTLVPYLAAAAVIGLISIIIFVFYPVTHADRLADNYIKEHLVVLSVSMGTSKDSIQTALSLYNENKLNKSADLFTQLARSYPTNNKLKEYAGIVSLRLGDYDKALTYFHDLEAQKNLYANPGKFYVALTLLKRNGPGDVIEAKQLLQQVTDLGLEHDADAKKLLGHL
jgi:hypothetical protein